MKEKYGCKHSRLKGSTGEDYDGARVHEMYELDNKGVLQSMEKYAWKAIIVEGQIEEYKRRHDNLWDEMKDVLKEAGICNYTIWNVGNELFGYYECELGVEHATKVQRESDVVKRWDEYMKDILVMEMDPETGAQPLLRQVFSYR